MQINQIFLQDADFPAQLREIHGRPASLYLLGKLPIEPMIAIVGTRNLSAYGEQVTYDLASELARAGFPIVSGLAFGVDAVAHQAALDASGQTVAVMAGGLDRIYPPAHRSLAKEMIEQGGLLTDFMTGDEPDRQNFPKRNRIVAGLADATIVIETGIKGGSMITAELANGYNKDVFAFPGRIKDVKSEGCNYLIRKNKAALISHANDLIEFMNWEEKKGEPKIQRSLFVKLTAQEEKIMNVISEKESIHIEEICAACALKSSEIASAILNLELQSVIQALPGKRYKRI